MREYVGNRQNKSELAASLEDDVWYSVQAGPDASKIGVRGRLH